MGSTIITVCARAARSNISCVDEDEAKAIMLEITAALAVTHIITPNIGAVSPGS